MMYELSWDQKIAMYKSKNDCFKDMGKVKLICRVHNFLKR